MKLIRLSIEEPKISRQQLQLCEELPMAVCDAHKKHWCFKCVIVNTILFFTLPVDPLVPNPLSPHGRKKPYINSSPTCLNSLGLKEIQIHWFPLIIQVILKCCNCPSVFVSRSNQLKIFAKNKMLSSVKGNSPF